MSSLFLSFLLSQSFHICDVESKQNLFCFNIFILRNMFWEFEWKLFVKWFTSVSTFKSLEK